MFRHRVNARCHDMEFGTYLDDRHYDSHERSSSPVIFIDPIKMGFRSFLPAQRIHFRPFFAGESNNNWILNAPLFMFLFSKSPEERSCGWSILLIPLIHNDLDPLLNFSWYTAAAPFSKFWLSLAKGINGQRRTQLLVENEWKAFYRRQLEVLTNLTWFNSAGVSTKQKRLTYH